jgi:hypothetical protein
MFETASTEQETVELIDDIGGVEMIVDIISDNMQLERVLWSLQKAEKDAESLDLQRKQSGQWYDTRLQKYADRAEFLKQQIKNYLENNKINKVATPSGTMFLVKRDSYVYPEDMTKVFEWAKTTGDATLIRVVPAVESLDKVAFKKYVKATGDTPDGVELVSKTTVQIK